jgi:DNA helicase HerA-like ATPase
LNQILSDTSQAVEQTSATAGASEVRIGHVLQVSGEYISGMLTPEASGVLQGAEGAYAPGQIGALVKIHTPASTVFGVVRALRVLEPVPEERSHERGALEINLFGEVMHGENGAPGVFDRGVSVYPVLGSDILAATADDLRSVYARAHGGSLQIGTIHQDRTVPAYVHTDDMLGKHFAILGTTGCGKSCAVALILQAILKQNPFGHVVLLDPHDEYRHAFQDQANVLDMNNLELPYWLLNFAETCEMFIGRGKRDDVQRSILKNAILKAKQAYIGDEAPHLTVDTPIPYRLSDMVRALDEMMGKLDKIENSGPYQRLKSVLEDLRGDRRYQFIFSGYSVRDTLADILSKILRIPVGGKPITIVDLSGVPSEIVDVVVSVLTRMIFDFGLWASKPQAVPILLVCEEAHRYVPRDSEHAFQPTNRAISRIAREGRKHGVSLCLVTQRPSEVSASVLSQCSTLFAMRMSNERDQDFLRNAMPESALGLLGALPSLRAQEAVAVGEGVSVPMRFRFSDLPEDVRPLGETTRFRERWHQDYDDAELLAQTVERWRRQQR